MIFSDLVKKYTSMGISVIPVTSRYDKKKNRIVGKVAATSWKEYQEDIVEDHVAEGWDSLQKTGIAFVTGEVSNLACIDIDVTDKAKKEAILKMLDYHGCKIIGDPERGGKLLYRLYDSPHNYVAPKDKKIVLDKVDIFLGSGYIVAPGSLHSKNRDGSDKIMYEWSKDAGYHPLSVHSYEQLPIYKHEYAAKIKMILDGMSQAEINNNMPVGKGIDLSGISVEASGNRFDDMRSFCASLIAKKFDPTTAVKELIQRDDIRNSDNPYFLDMGKGHSSQDKAHNAFVYYMQNFLAHNQGKKSGQLETPSLGKEVVYISNDEWGEIKSKVKTELPPFNYKLIQNKDLRKYIQDGSVANSLSPQNIYFYLLGTFSSLVGNKIKIKPYRHNKGYAEPCNLYIGNIAPSGERKTMAVSLATKFIKRLNKEVKKSEKEAFLRDKQFLKDLNVSISRKEKDRNKELEESGVDSEFAKELLGEIEKLKERRPVERQVSLYEHEMTIQKFYEIVEHNQEGIFQEISEMGPKWEQLQQKTHAEEKSFYLRAWDGNQDFSYKTKHNGENIIDELSISVGFSVQTDVFESIISTIGTSKASKDGLIQRFLFFFSDGDKRSYTDIDFDAPESIYQIFQSAYYMEKNDTPVYFCSEATDVWENFSNWLADASYSEPNTDITSSIEKYSGYFVRLSGLIECFSCGGNRPQSISRSSAELAWDIIKYAEKHLRHAYRLQDIAKEDDIIDMLKNGMIEDEISMRDLYRNYQYLVGRNSSAAKKVLNGLVDRNIIKIVREGRAERIKINPALFHC